MKRHNLGNTIKKLRSQQGMSQELLAEESGLSLRTIQRIENAETTPSGDSLHKLSNALRVSPNELTDWTAVEDIDFLKKLNLSALTFIFFPLLGILVPSLLWISKKDKIKGIDLVAKNVINFEITWTIFFFVIPFFVPPILYRLIENVLYLFKINIYINYDPRTDTFIIWVIMYILNTIFIIINSFRIHDSKSPKYFPLIKFLKT